MLLPGDGFMPANHLRHPRGEGSPFPHLTLRKEARPHAIVVCRWRSGLALMHGYYHLDDPGLPVLRPRRPHDQALVKVDEHS